MMSANILNDADTFLKEIEEQKNVVKELVQTFNEKAETIVQQYFEDLSAQDIVYFAGNNEKAEISLYDIRPTLGKKADSIERDAQNRSKSVEDFTNASPSIEMAKKALKRANISLDVEAKESRIILKYSHCQPNIK